MEWIPGIIITIFYITWIFIKNSRQKSTKDGKLKISKMLIYGLFLGAFLGIFGAIKIVYFPNIGSLSETVLNTSLVLFILFIGKLLKYLKIDVYN